MILGCLSYGTLKGYFYQGSPDSVKRKLAAKLHIFNPNPNPAVHGDIKILSNWLETIRQVRNMVAHHDRFWNETSTHIVPKRLSIGAVRTPMNGGQRLDASERTLPARRFPHHGKLPAATNRWLRMEEQIHQPHGPLSGNSCNGNGIPRGLAITRIVVMTTDAHRPWFHDPLIMICKRPPEVGDRAVTEKLNDRLRKTLSYRKPSEAMLELINDSVRSESKDKEDRPESD